jgi:hypothetical protein
MVKIRCAILWLWRFSVLFVISSCWRCSGPFPPPPSASYEHNTDRVGASEGSGWAWASPSPTRAWASEVVSSGDCVEDCTTVSSSEYLSYTYDKNLIKKQENWLLFFIVIKIKEKKKVSVQEQCLLLLQILPKFWSRFQLIGLKSTQRHKCFKGARCLWYYLITVINFVLKYFFRV